VWRDLDRYFQTIHSSGEILGFQRVSPDSSVRCGTEGVVGDGLLERLSRLLVSIQFKEDLAKCNPAGYEFWL